MTQYFKVLRKFTYRPQSQTEAYPRGKVAHVGDVLAGDSEIPSRYLPDLITQGQIEPCDPPEVIGAVD